MGNMSNHFYIEKNYADFFKKSEILNSSRTEGIIKRENFLLLMALGYSMGFKTKFENPKAKGNDTFVMNQLTKEELSLVYAIAISDSKDPEIVNNDIKVADIAMEYANTGIVALKELEENSQKGNRIKKFQAEIHDFIEDSS
ncbi:MAG: hypothetical protein E7Z81_10415 [Methanobrevibacter sp.]|uniref:hypothetical protein n=1 Tax=Methanobrevibacter sp. TaxID=66852 RepID=UPI0025DC87B3|nr:hypothetical protein [Methanobrevibacter sp.]MBE6498659.1 hypothetical protein [Methanobrevibacter sp.]